MKEDPEHHVGLPYATEWYAEIAVRFGERMPVQTEGYTERMERFEGLLSGFLGGPFESSMIGFAGRLETYVYVEASSPEEAAVLAIRSFREAAEVAWGPGTAAEVLRVVTTEERDRELEEEEAREAGRVLADEGDDVIPFERSDGEIEVEGGAASRARGFAEGLRAKYPGREFPDSAEIVREDRDRGWGSGRDA